MCSREQKIIRDFKRQSASNILKAAKDTERKTTSVNVNLKINRKDEKEGKNDYDSAMIDYTLFLTSNVVC